MKFVEVTRFIHLTHSPTFIVLCEIVHTENRDGCLRTFCTVALLNLALKLKKKATPLGHDLLNKTKGI